MVGKGRRDAIATLLMLVAAPAAYGFQIAGMSNMCPHCRHSFAASTTALRSHVPLIMLAKKPFKGGRLDDFLSAGEAEAKYGPGRYAAVSEDMWKVKLKEEGINAARERTKQEFKALEFQLLQQQAQLQRRQKQAPQPGQEQAGQQAQNGSDTHDRQLPARTSGRGPRWSNE